MGNCRRLAVLKLRVALCSAVHCERQLNRDDMGVLGAGFAFMWWAANLSSFEGGFSPTQSVNTNQESLAQGPPRARSTCLPIGEQLKCFFLFWARGFGVCLLPPRSQQLLRHSMAGQQREPRPQNLALVLCWASNRRPFVRMCSDPPAPVSQSVE